MNHLRPPHPSQPAVKPGNSQAFKPVRLAVSVWTWLTWCHAIRFHIAKVNPCRAVRVLILVAVIALAGCKRVDGQTTAVYLTNVASHWTVSSNNGVVVTSVAYRTNAPAPAGKTFEPVFLAGLQGTNVVTVTVSTNSDGNPVLEDICQNVTLINFVHKGMLAPRTESRLRNEVNMPTYEYGSYADLVRYLHRTNSLPAPVMQTAPMYGTQPNASEIALQWEANPDCERYVVEYLSARTTNQWLKAGTFRPTPGLSFVNASIFVDLDVPCWTRVIGITESGDRTPPTEPLRHPALSNPRPMGKVRRMFERTATNVLTATEMHRNRTDPFPIIPQPPIP